MWFMTRKCGEKLEGHLLELYNMDILKKNLKDAKRLYSKLLRFGRVLCAGLER